MARGARRSLALAGLVLPAVGVALVAALSGTGCGSKFGETDGVDDGGADVIDRPDTSDAAFDAPTMMDAADAADASNARPCEDPSLVFCADFDHGLMPWGFDGISADGLDGGAMFATSATTSVSPPNAAFVTSPGPSSYAFLGKTIALEPRAYRLELDVDVEEIQPDAPTTLVSIGLSPNRALQIETNNDTAELWVFDTAPMDGGTMSFAQYKVSPSLLRAWHHVRVDANFNTGAVVVAVDTNVAAVGPGIATRNETTVGLYVGVYAANTSVRARFDNVAISWH